MAPPPGKPTVLNVTRLQIVARGLSNRCPNCGKRALFKSGTLFQLNPACLQCGLVLERDEGFFLGSMSLNYGVTLVCFLTPVMLLAYKGIVSSTTAIVLAIVGSLAVPALLYRSSRCWWLMNYYLFLPWHLPANRVEVGPGEDHNV